MYQINITLGDAIFVVTDDSIKLKSSMINYTNYTTKNMVGIVLIPF